MTEEQKTIAKRLGIVAGSLAVIILIFSYAYSPAKVSPGNSTKVYAAGTRPVVAVYRSGTWFVDTNGNDRWDQDSDFSLAVGKPGDTPISGTWDVAEGPSVGSFKNGVFTLVVSGKIQVYSFGMAGDVPVVGDWNGDGRSKVGVFRNGYWVLDYNGNGVFDGPEVDRQFPVGTVGDTPIVGDWNGDGKTDVGVYRPDGYFALDVNGSMGWDKDDKLFAIGQPGGLPIVGDWNGDGRSKVGIFNKGFWVLDYNGNQKWDGAVIDKFTALGGVAGEIPVMGDWNGGGKIKLGVYRQTQWFLDTNANDGYDKGDRTIIFGIAGDIPAVIAPLRKKP